MSTRKKCAWLLVATGALVALIIAAGKLYSATRNPLSAFEREKAGETSRYLADKSGSTARSRVGKDPSLSLGAQRAPQSGPHQAQAPLQHNNPGNPGAAAPAPEPTVDPAVELGGSKVAITLLGIDSNVEREERKMGSRSDVMVICVIDMAAPSCSILTIPRDTRAKVRRLNSAGEIRSTRTDKINAAYAYGGGDPEKSCENALFALNALLGTDLTYYAAMDMDGIGPLTEALDGVTVTLPADIDGVGREGQTVTLNGETAYTYIRKRKGVQGGSDLSRTARQQIFIKALAKRVKELGVSAIPALWNTMAPRVTTNVSLSQMVALGTVLSHIDTDAIETFTLPGRSKTIDGTSFYVADRDETRKLVRALFGQ
ncbi:MAG: LCP family protein [Christensenellales bacterium]|jgi:LCP family protein required for cell wall assembly